MTKKVDRFLAGFFPDILAFLNHLKVLIKEKSYIFCPEIVRQSYEKGFDRSNIIVEPLELEIFVKP